MYKVSPERERSPFRAQTANDRPSRSPARVNTDYDRPRTPIESGTHSRDTSASRPNTGNYFFQPQTSPYVNGKKNENFLHPSFTSNNIFYDHNYGYKNDLPNDRLLTPVKNDKHRKNDDDNVSNRGDRTPPKSPLQRNQRDTSEDNLLRTQSYTARRLITEENPLRNNLNRSVDIALNKDKDSALNTRKNSIISQNAPTPNRYGRYNRETMDTSPDIKAAGRPSGVNNNNKRDYDDNSTRDDRSETSTVMSTLSSTGYLCPKCLNRHMVGAKNAACAVAREQEKDHENRITNMHMKYLEQQEAQKQLERTKRAQDTREAQKKLEEDYQARREQRRSPEKEKDTSFKKMFDRQEEMRQKQLMLKQVFGTHLKDQMNARDNEKEREKRANAQPYDTTLRMGGNDYYNKYLDDPAAVRSTLQNQIEEKTIRQNREKEAEKRSAQQKETQALKELQEEEQKRKMKEWIHKKELREAFARHAENKEQQQREAALSKSQERVAMDQGYNQYKKKQKEEEEKTRKQLFDFKQYLVKQQEKLSYKQQYEERKQQKEATSFDPTSKKIKKKYPCGECNDPYEKVHLTKMH